MRFYFYVFALIIHWHYINTSQYRMYQTDPPGINAIHCIYTRFFYQRQIIGDLFAGSYSYQNNRFCRGRALTSTDTVEASEKSAIHGVEFSFDSLRAMNISAKQLYEWNAPIDTVESYAMREKVGKFFNCSSETDRIWFGPQCQYSTNIFNDTISYTGPILFLRAVTSVDMFLFTNGTCYRIDTGDCGSILCLDWREICDGKIDCTNGLDERHCEELEMNECDDRREFRCLNGQCIDKVLYLDGDLDCLDSSDELSVTRERVWQYSCDKICEDKLCPRTWFSCGDGMCYNGPHTDKVSGCDSKRDVLYFQRMPTSTFILFAHVSLIYNENEPQWICYNNLLCPQLSWKNHTESVWQSNNTIVCRKFTNFTNVTFASFDEMLFAFKDFVQTCSLPPIYHVSDLCSMFSCDNNSKCISYHRLFDGTNDCPNGEDERQNYTCSLGFPHRYSCDSGTRCIRETLLSDGIGHCADKSDEFHPLIQYCAFTSFYTPRCSAYRGDSSKFNMEFPHLCDGIQDYYPDEDNNTDESDCFVGEWSCSNKYTKCNRIWNCPDGRDELGCEYMMMETLGECGRNFTHFCLNISSGTPLCLSSSKVNDGHVDCLGSTDERSFCRKKYPYEFTRRYRCLNSDVCISPTQTCDCHQDCPDNDDETTACNWKNNGLEPYCHPTNVRCRDGRIIECEKSLCRCVDYTYQCEEAEDFLLCDLIDIENTQKESKGWYEQQNAHDSSKQYKTIVMYEPSIPQALVAWKCNYGTFVLSTESPSGFYCFCSQYYYGDYCQYQRKRVSLVIQPFIADSFTHQSIFKFVVLLIRQNRTIISHDYFVHVPQIQCFSKYHIALLFPINESWSPLLYYTVHVHSFIASSMEYWGSWYWNVPFTFLPVIRMAKRISLNNTVVSKLPSFNIMYDGNLSKCSNSSVSIGFDTELSREICVCPLNLTGSRCFIPLNPCTNESCNGHGQCIAVNDRSEGNDQISCVCDPGWHESYCDRRAGSIHISLGDKIKIPSFHAVLVHIITPQYTVDHITEFHRIREQSRAFILMPEVPLDRIALIFIQLFENLYKFEFYLMPPLPETVQRGAAENISIEFALSHRCVPIKELFNATLLAQKPLGRVKHFHRICRQRSSIDALYCFYDEKLMCYCDKTNQADCFNFDTTSKGCSWNTCSDRGRCIQNRELCPHSSSCLCEPCSYGSICQFTMNGYSMSLDAILGSHVKIMSSNIFRHTNIIKISALIISVVVTVGTLVNILAIGTFSQRKPRQVGCGLYLYASSIFGLFTIIILTCKMILLIGIEQHDISCAITEFLLKWCPACCDWLHALVAVERGLAVIRGSRYSSRVSQHRARVAVVILPLSIAGIYFQELIYNRVVVDEQDKRAWCVFFHKPEQSTLKKLYITSNLSLFVFPLVINVISSIIIIGGTLRSRQKAAYGISGVIQPGRSSIVTPNNQISLLQKIKLQWIPIKAQIIKHKQILIGPALLSTFSTSRLVMSLITVCTKLDGNPILTLIGYLIGFFPSVSIFFAFILPSETYRESCWKFIKSVKRKFTRQ